MIDLAALDRLIARLTRSSGERERFFADRAGYLAPLELDGETHRFALQHLDAPARVRLSLAHRLAVDALAVRTRAALPHTLDTLARHRAVDDALFEELLAAARGPHDLGPFLDGLGLPCNYLGDLAALELAVGRARALRSRLADHFQRAPFAVDGERPLSRNRWLGALRLGRDLPWRDFPVHLSGRPPVTWPATLPARDFALVACVERAAPHALSLVEIEPPEIDLLARADGTRNAAALGASDRQIEILVAAGLLGCPL